MELCWATDVCEVSVCVFKILSDAQSAFNEAEVIDIEKMERLNK